VSGAYQFAEGQKLSGGTYDTNMSFVQALTEAAKLVPNAIVMGSLPESDIEAGSQRGVAALRALEETFGRVQALWKPVATDEAFEIVRRRLFEPVYDAKSRDAVCRAFADAYVAEGARSPSETQESRYYDRLVHAYPIHPEIFDRLYEDWTTIEGFQRTRGDRSARPTTRLTTYVAYVPNVPPNASRSGALTSDLTSACTDIA
jgi:predicted AAA+ superfamily ATPase